MGNGRTEAATALPGQGYSRGRITVKTVRRLERGRILGGRSRLDCREMESGHGQINRGLKAAQTRAAPGGWRGQGMGSPVSAATWPALTQAQRACAVRAGVPDGVLSQVRCLRRTARHRPDRTDSNRPLRSARGAKSPACTCQTSSGGVPSRHTGLGSSVAPH